MSNKLRQRVGGENLPPTKFCHWVFKLFVTNFWSPMGSKHPLKTFPKSYGKIHLPCKEIIWRKVEKLEFGKLDTPKWLKLKLKLDSILLNSESQIFFLIYQPEKWTFIYLIFKWYLILFCAFLTLPTTPAPMWHFTFKITTLEIDIRV